MESPSHPAESSGRLPGCWSANLTGEGSAVSGSHQILGSRDQCPRDQCSPGIHLGGQRVAHPRYLEDVEGLFRQVRVLPEVYRRLRNLVGAPRPVHTTGSARRDFSASPGQGSHPRLPADEGEAGVRSHLGLPQFHGAPFILDTDFSVDPGAIGGVLSQVQDGQERVIAYGARRLLPRERNYASTKGELLAVIFFLQYYKYYLLHRPFVLRTDNRALTWIRSLESPTGMILRWLEILASFDFTVQHRKGTLHGNADSLSRAPHASFPTTEEEKVLVSDETAVVAAVQTPPGFTTEEIRDHQERDDNLQDVRRWKETPPSEAEQRLLSPDQRRLLAFLPSLHQDPSSNLWSLQTSEEDTSKERLYVPSALRHRVIEAAHQFLGHAGTTATAHFCRKRFFMFRLIPEVHRAIQQCHACQVKSQKGPKQQDVHRPSVQAGAPFQVWSMDVMGPLRASSEGHRYLLTLKDVFSKWFEAIPLSNTTSEKVLRALQTLYARFGYPLQVHTDNATYFRSQAMREAFQRSGVRLTFTPTYNPQSNSVERTHRDLGTMLRVLCHQHTADWEEVLPAALLALRSAVHESTGVTPFACVYGKEPATPLDLISRVPDAPLAAHTYVRRLEDHQFRAHRAVQTQLGRALQRTSRRYGDEKDAIQPGEKVWLFTSKPAADRKLAIPLLRALESDQATVRHTSDHPSRGGLVPPTQGYHRLLKPA